MRTTSAVAAATAALAVGLLGATGPASAAQKPRLEGTWNVEQTITLHATKPSDVGRRIDVKFRFTPKCDVGGCATKLRFNNGERIIKITLRPNAKDIYVAEGDFLGNCYSTKTGELLAKNAYGVVATFRIHVDKVDGKGRATEISGTRGARFTRLAGAPKKCDKHDRNSLSLTASR